MTDVDFSLPDPELERYTWVYDNEHEPASEPPLTRGRAFGTLIDPGSPPSHLIINGYSYYCLDPSDNSQGGGTPPDLVGRPPSRIGDRNGSHR